METIQWISDTWTLKVLDQQCLPEKESYIDCKTVEDICNVIKSLNVRGAPAIGVTAAYGMLFSGEFTKKHLNIAAKQLKAARPTAVNLSWGVEQVLNKAEELYQSANIRQDLENFITGLHHQDRMICRAIGESGLPLIKTGTKIMTICNAGKLATCGIGTATAPMYLAYDEGIKFKVFACETRPVLQGMRLTAFELSRHGIDTTLICDCMAAYVMETEKIDMVFIGADRIADNCDTANKIGSLNLAIIAKHYNVPFYVCAPNSTFDNKTKTGKDIIIEHRHPNEVLNDRKLAVNILNPAFDIVPGTLITAFITEYGIKTV